MGGIARLEWKRWMDVCMLFNSEPKDKTDCGRFWNSFLFFQMGHVLFPTHWHCCLQSKVSASDILLFVCFSNKLHIFLFTKLKEPPHPPTCDRRSSSQIESLLSCLVYVKSLAGHDRGRRLWRAEWIILKAGQFSKTAIGQAGHVGHYLSKSILVEVIRSSSKELLLLGIGNEINLPLVHIKR